MDQNEVAVDGITEANESSRNVDKNTLWPQARRATSAISGINPLWHVGNIATGYSTIVSEMCLIFSNSASHFTNDIYSVELKN